MAQLLTTKLNIPRPRSHLVSRPRLIERLNEGLRADHKLTLISAPAGFGKTTLLSAWIAQVLDIGDWKLDNAATDQSPIPNPQSPKFAWLALDEGDNDPARFLAYVVAALQGIEATVGEGVLSALQSPQPSPAASVEPLLTGLLNEIAAIPDPFVLVLEDYHLITAQPIHDAVTFLLDHQPPQLHLVIATRADPPLPLARLRGRAQMTELRAADLRFTPDEAATFLNQVMGLRLSTQDVAALERRTEGWITGLQLAALSMREREDTSGFIQAFTGSHRYVLDYLVEEVLQTQPKQMRTFLLHTSILDRLCGPLCDAVRFGVTKSHGDRPGANPQAGPRMLERLERENLFILPLDDERRWYRYHPLFADLMRHRLRETHPDLVNELHDRASHWYEENSLVNEAIEHALTGRNFERAADLIGKTARDRLMRGESATVRAWIEALPEALRRARPRLALAHAAVLVSVRDLDGIEAQLQVVEAWIAAGDTGNHSPAEIVQMGGEVAAHRAALRFWRGDIGGAIALCREALASLPEEDLYLRGRITLLLGLSQRRENALEQASRALTASITINQQAGNVNSALTAAAGLAGLHEVQGRLGEASRVYQQALRLATGKRGQYLPPAGTALIGLGKIHRERDDLETATRYLHAGIELAERGGAELAQMDGTITLALVCSARSDWEQAHHWLARAEEIAARWNRPRVTQRVAVFRARLWLAQGRLDDASDWARQSGLHVDDEPSDWLEVAHLTFARALIARGRAQAHPTITAGALRLLQRLLGAAETAGRNGSKIEILALMALAFAAQGEMRQAADALESALMLAAPEGYARLFLDEGEPLASLLRRVASRGVLPEYVHGLLSKFGDAATPGPPPTGLLVEPLTERELQVLALAADGRSNREIAQALVVTSGTIKRHLHNIYGKLGVHNRTEAAACARELDLLRGITHDADWLE